MNLPDSIYTFEFDYFIESELLKSIVEVDRDNYVFIPNINMFISFSISKVSQTLIIQKTIIIYAVVNL